MTHKKHPETQTQTHLYHEEAGLLWNAVEVHIPYIQPPPSNENSSN